VAHEVDRLVVDVATEHVKVVAVVEDGRFHPDMTLAFACLS
jgi:hypothetical protein